jgi:hypothetical protein
VQRCAKDLFEQMEIAKNSGNRVKMVLNVSFLQLYNEKIFDLLNTDMFKKNNVNRKMVFNMGRNNPD